MKTWITLTSLLLSIPAMAVTIDRIVAVVNDQAITERDIDHAMRNPQYAKAKSSRQSVLNEMINTMLMDQAMQSADIVVTEEDLNRSMRNIMAQFGMRSTDQLRAAAAKEGLTFEQYRENLRRHLKQMKFVNQEVGSQIHISDQDLEDYYRQHMKKFSGASAVHLAQIVFPFSPTMTQTDAEALQQKVKEVVSHLNRNNFKQLAKQYSGGPNASQGGDMGVVDPSTLQPEVSKEVLQMQPGEISKPIVTSSGINIVMVLDRSAATDKDFIRLKDQIYNILFEQRMQEALKGYMAQLRQKSYVQIN